MDERFMRELLEGGRLKLRSSEIEIFTKKDDYPVCRASQKSLDQDIHRGAPGIGQSIGKDVLNLETAQIERIRHGFWPHGAEADHLRP